MRPHLANQSESLANDFRQCVENLSEIAAAFLLNLKCGCENPQIRQRHSDNQILERLAQGQAEFMLPICEPEFLSHRIRHFCAEQLKACCKGMTGADGACQ